MATIDYIAVTIIIAINWILDQLFHFRNILLDTGCSRTLVQKDLVPKHKLLHGEVCGSGTTCITKEMSRGCPQDST